MVQSKATLGWGSPRLCTSMLFCSQAKSCTWLALVQMWNWGAAWAEIPQTGYGLLVPGLVLQGFSCHGYQENPSGALVMEKTSCIFFFQKANDSVFSFLHLSKTQPSFKSFLRISSYGGNEGKHFPVKGGWGYGCPKPWWHFSTATLTGAGPAWPRRWHVWCLGLPMQVDNTVKKCAVGPPAHWWLGVFLSWRIRPGCVTLRIKMAWDCMLPGTSTAAEISKQWIR